MTKVETYLRIKFINLVDWLWWIKLCQLNQRWAYTSIWHNWIDVTVIGITVLRKIM